MLVFGDVERREPAEALRQHLLSRIEAIHSQSEGLSRHAALVSAFIDAAALVGGAIDVAFARRETDAPEDGASGMKVLTNLARVVVASWDGGVVARESLDPIIKALTQLRLPDEIATKAQEGYAFYALFPESYIEAARRSGLGSKTRVIGIRSIGTGLAAIVSAALGAPPPLTVRPMGHPFARRISADPQLETEVLADDASAFALVDEGPGLSGSSFGAAADWLEGLGIPAERIHFFPSHMGDLGPQASASHRQRWVRAARHHTPFENGLLGRERRLQMWIAELVGPLAEPLQDISGGGWRAVADVDDAVPLATQWERRKFLATTRDARWIARFVGLGEEGERKLRLARELETSGFGAPVAGVCHGFLVQRWIEGVNLTRTRLLREMLMAQLGAYLGFRTTLAAASDGGATLQTLAQMARFNAKEAFGDEVASRLGERLSSAANLEPMVRRVAVDGRLHRWEWVLRPDGRLLKADALDHSRAHDFIGAQDIAWDVAGAIAEHDLTDGEVSALISTISRQVRREVNPDLIGFMLPCYLAFQLGAWTMSNGTDAPITRRYAGKLAALTSSPAP